MRPQFIYSRMRYDIHCLQDPNRVGNVPMHWYDDMPHIGYDIDGKKVMRPAVGDELDKFLKTQEDPAAWCVSIAPRYRIAEFAATGCLLWTGTPKRKSDYLRRSLTSFADCTGTKTPTLDTIHTNLRLNGSLAKGKRK